MQKQRERNRNEDMHVEFTEAYSLFSPRSLCFSLLSFSWHADSDVCTRSGVLSGNLLREDFSDILSKVVIIPTVFYYHVFIKALITA